MALWRIFPADTTPSRLVNEGIELFNDKRYEEANQCFTKALEIDPGSAVASIAWGRKGNCLVNLKQYEEAVECYDRSLEINPQFSNIWYIKGYVLDSLGKREEALACYDRAIEISPDFALAWKAKGDLLFARGEYEEAEHAYAHAVELNPALQARVGSSRSICAQFTTKPASAAVSSSAESSAESAHSAPEPVPASSQSTASPAIAGLQQYEETIRRFLGEMEKSQLRTVRQTVAHDIAELQAQIGSGREMVQELLEISLKQQELIGKMNLILELQSSFIDRLMEEKEGT